MARNLKAGLLSQMVAEWADGILPEFLEGIGETVTASSPAKLVSALALAGFEVNDGEDDKSLALTKDGKSGTLRFGEGVKVEPVAKFTDDGKSVKTYCRIEGQYDLNELDEEEVAAAAWVAAGNKPLPKSSDLTEPLMVLSQLPGISEARYLWFPVSMKGAMAARLRALATSLAPDSAD